MYVLVTLVKEATLNYQHGEPPLSGIHEWK